jgi:hypothetical protein
LESDGRLVFAADDSVGEEGPENFWIVVDDSFAGAFVALGGAVYDQGGGAFAVLVGGFVRGGRDVTFTPEMFIAGSSDRGSVPLWLVEEWSRDVARNRMIGEIAACGAADLMLE